MIDDAGDNPDIIDGEPRRRNPLRRFRRIPMRIVIPNLVTLLALCLGLTAIRFASEGAYENAVISIVAAAVLDGLDGRIARALEGTTRFGAELDSLADFVDFGVAPGLLLYFWSLHENRNLGWFAALMFAVACALRLARFNVMLDEPDRPAWTSHFFVGMPAPAGAIVGMLPLYLHFGVGLPAERTLAGFESLYVLLVAWLMASRIPHFSGKTIGRVPREWFIPVLFGVMVGMLLLATYPMQMLICLAVSYLALIPFSIRRFQAFRKGDQALKPADPVADALPN